MRTTRATCARSIRNVSVAVRSRGFPLGPLFLGFVHSESSGDARVDRRAETALRDVASLLVFQQAMQGPPAQAFKKVMKVPSCPPCAAN